MGRGKNEMSKDTGLFTKRLEKRLRTDKSEGQEGGGGSFLTSGQVINIQCWRTPDHENPGGWGLSKRGRK